MSVMTSVAARQEGMRQSLHVAARLCAPAHHHPRASMSMIP